MITSTGAYPLRVGKRYDLGPGVEIFKSETYALHVGTDVLITIKVYKILRH